MTKLDREREREILKNINHLISRASSGSSSGGCPDRPLRTKIIWAYLTIIHRRCRLAEQAIRAALWIYVNFDEAGHVRRYRSSEAEEVVAAG